MLPVVFDIFFESNCQQYSSRWEAREYVGSQFTGRCGEKDKRQNEVTYQEAAEVVLKHRLELHFQRDKCTESHQCSGEYPSQHGRNEEPEWFSVLSFAFSGKSLDMFDPEEIVPEFRFFDVNCNCPWEYHNKYADKRNPWSSQE